MRLKNTNRHKWQLFNIPGYHFISNSREHKLGGGVGLYIQSDMNFKPRIDLQSSDNSLYESVFVEIMWPHGKNIIVGCLYRPPNASLNDFNRSVEDILSAISFENKLSYIMGDFNINILNSHSHQPTNEFINVMTSNSLYPLISKPTRITSSSATLIDNIFTNNLELNVNSVAFFTLTYLITSQFFKLPTWKWLLSHHAKRDLYVLLTQQLCQHSGLNWKVSTGLQSIPIIL